MARFWNLLAVSALLVCLVLPRAAAAEEPGAEPAGLPVDVQLVLAVDSSGSISADEFRLQMAGFAAAFRHPSVLEAVRRGARGAIAVTLVEWSSVQQQHQSVAWTMLSDEESMVTFADQIETAPRFVPGGSTALGDALRYAAALFETSGFASPRQVIDVSGDGSNNSGPAPDTIRDGLVERGIVINGLAILSDEPNLSEYYGRSVIGGPGAFVLVAESYETFSTAILSKLIQEICALPTPVRQAGLGDR